MNKASIRAFIERVNVILVTAHCRSGSLFMQSLFDEHEEVVSFMERHYRYDYIRSLQPENAMDEFCRDRMAFFDTRNSYFSEVGWSVVSLLGENRDQHATVDIDHFKQAFRDAVAEFDAIDRRTFFILLHYALCMEMGKNPDTVKYILFHLHFHNFEAAAELLEDFPQVRHIATTRDPREWIAGNKVRTSLEMNVKRHTNETYISLMCIPGQFQFLFWLRDRLAPGCLKVVDLNRLHDLQEKAMQMLADWLRITYNDSLCHSTILGLTWWGNTAEKTPLDGFDRRRSTYKYSERLSKTELAVAEYMSRNILEQLFYKAPTFPIWNTTQVVTAIISAWPPITPTWIVLPNAKKMIGRTEPFSHPVVRHLPMWAAKLLGYLYYLYYQNLYIPIKLFFIRYSPFFIRTAVNQAAEIHDTLNHDEII